MTGIRDLIKPQVARSVQADCQHQEPLPNRRRMTI
jgi:hypothetical protein